MSVKMHLKLVEEINKLAEQLSRLTLSDEVELIFDVGDCVITPTELGTSTCEGENGHAQIEKDMSTDTNGTGINTSVERESFEKLESGEGRVKREFSCDSSVKQEVNTDSGIPAQKESGKDTERTVILEGTSSDVGDCTKLELSTDSETSTKQETNVDEEISAKDKTGTNSETVAIDKTSTNSETVAKEETTTDNESLTKQEISQEIKTSIKEETNVDNETSAKQKCADNEMSAKQLSTVSETSAKFYAVALPEEAERPGDPETLIFGDFKDAIKAMKSFKGSRFKQFSNKEDALRYSSGSLEKVVPKPKLDEEGSSFRSATSQELCQLRKHIERGDEDIFARTVWNNPKTLVGSCDTPSIMQEGMRYNALHVAAKSNKPFLCQLILDTIENPDFVKLIYPSKTDAERQNIVCRLLDLYINTPDKKTGDTPLHYASKFGCIDCVKVLLSHPSCVPDRRNVAGFTPREIICSRMSNKSPSLVEDIEEAFEGLMYIPILRSESDDIPAVIGKPCPCKEIITSTRGPNAKASDETSLSLKAFIGPMSTKFAEQLYLIFKNPTSSKATFYSPDEMKVISKIRFTDRRRGLERIGRWLADDLNFQWQEYVPVLNVFTNLALDDGLQVLESHFEKDRYIPDDPDEMSIYFVHEYPSHINPLAHYVNVQLERENKKNLDANYDDIFSTPPSSPMKNPDGDCFSTPPGSPSTHYSNMFLQGSSFSKLDADTLQAIGETAIDADRYPNVFRWKSLVERENRLLDSKEPNTPGLESLSLLTSVLRLNENVCTPRKTILNKAFRFESNS